MKILVLATTFPRWKDDTEPAFVYYLSNQLARDYGHDITVLVPHAYGAAFREEMDNIKVIRFPYFWPFSLQKVCYNGGALPNLKASWLARLELPFLLLMQFFYIFKYLFVHHCDLVHSHWLIPQGFFAAVLKKIFKVPVVVTAHAGDVFIAKSKSLKKIIQFVMRNSDACTVNSEATKRAVKAITDISRIETIPMGVDLSLFSPGNKDCNLKNSIGLKQDDKIILSVGRFAEKKGLLYLVEAMPIILKSVPNAKLLFIGFGPDEFLLRHMVQERNLDSSVMFLGKKPNTALPAFYSTADVFVLPSIVDSKGDTEGLGVVLLEAIASGCPVVASNVGGITDIVKHEKTGLLSEPKDVEQLAENIIRVLTDKELAHKLTIKGQEHIAANFTWPAVANKFNSLFSSILTEREVKDETYRPNSMP